MMKDKLKQITPESVKKLLRSARSAKAAVVADLQPRNFSPFFTVTFRSNFKDWFEFGSERNFVSCAPYLLGFKKASFSFLAPESGTISELTFLMGTFGTTQRGNLCIKLRSSTHETRGERALHSLTDNQFDAISFPPLPVKKNEAITVVVSLQRAELQTRLVLWGYHPDDTKRSSSFRAIASQETDRVFLPRVHLNSVRSPETIERAGWLGRWYPPAHFLLHQQTSIHFSLIASSSVAADSLRLFVSTFGRLNQGMIKISLHSADNSVAWSKIIEAQTLIDNAPLEISLHEVSIPPQTALDVTITAPGVSESAPLAVWGSFLSPDEPSFRNLPHSKDLQKVFLNEPLVIERYPPFSFEGFRLAAAARRKGVKAPTETSVKVSIVTVLYRKERELPFFLEALSRQTFGGSIEVIAVDDASPDRSSELFSAWSNANPEITSVLISLPHNQGNCSARNQGIAKASGDIIVIIDADCLINDTFIDWHVFHHRAGNAEIVIGPLNLETGLRPPMLALREYEHDIPRVHREMVLQDTTCASSFLNCITRNFSIQRSFINLPLFDEQFSYSTNSDSGFGWEDVDMGYSLYKQNARIAFAEEAFSVHISHPPSIPDQEKPLRSAKNLRRLLEKHPELKNLSRRWVTDTIQKLSTWAHEVSAIPDENLTWLLALNTPERKAISYPAFRSPPRIVSYRWHCPHQYELYKLQAQVTLLRGTGTPWTNDWGYEQRPFPKNAQFIRIDDFNEKDFDCAILHFDENSLSSLNCNNVLEPEWGNSFKWFMENVSLPKVAICHGTPQFYGQYNPSYDRADLGTPIELERERMVQFLGDTLVVCNSHQAQEEWQFKNSTVIWQGFDPAEFAMTTYQGGILALGKAMYERPWYRGLQTHLEIEKRLPPSMKPQAVKVSPPSNEYAKDSFAYAAAKFRNYAESLRTHSIYLNTTIRSPMPRSRGEAMMCGLVTVSTNNHDVNRFITNEENGFYSDDPESLADMLKFLLSNQSALEKMGRKSRETSIDLFNHDRYLARWGEIIKGLIS